MHSETPDLSIPAELLKRGETVAVPTETVYGLAAHALNERAVQKIFKAKGRPLTDPLIVHIHSYEQLDELAELPAEALPLVDAFWPGALTLVLPKKSVVPDLITAGLPSVAIRMPGHPLFQKLLEAVDLPLAAPSANPFGYVSPTCAAHVKEQLGSKIPYILDGGPCDIGIESTILQLTDPSTPTILRPGPISVEAIEAVLKCSVAIKSSSSAPSKAQLAPGMLSQHYSPNTPVELVENGQLTSFENPQHAYAPIQAPGQPQANIVPLSQDGNLEAVAHNLFATLRALDHGDYTQITVEKAPQEGIGIAINDRLSRAAAKRNA